MPDTLIRFIRLVWILCRHNALFLFEDKNRAAPFLWILRPVINANAQGRPGQRLAAALCQAGPAFVKFGQSLAVRGDLLGEEVAKDLSNLQDSLPAFSYHEAKNIIEKGLNSKIDNLFVEFSQKPIAAASIAQVHKAVTPEGDVVAVKVLRPNVKDAIERDLRFLEILAWLFELLSSHRQRFQAVASMKRFKTSTLRELDLRLEAAAASELYQNCKHDQGFRVPRVDWRRTCSTVATFEWIDGMSVTDADALRDAGHDPDKIMQCAAEVFFYQVFRDGYFHGDMHPGNMLIDTDGTIVALDFGIMGRVDEDDRLFLAGMLYGFVRRDFVMVARSFADAGLLVDQEEIDDFALACRAVGEPILDLPLKEISIGQLLGQVLSLAFQYNLKVQPHLLLLQKTMIVAEGVGRYLNPNLNMWQTAEPLISQWMASNLAPHAKLKRNIRKYAKLVDKLAHQFHTNDSHSAVKFTFSTILPTIIVNLLFTLGIVCALIVIFN